MVRDGDIEGLHFSCPFCCEECVEPVEPFGPEPLVVRRPLHDPPERPRVERQRVLPPQPPAPHQAGALEHPHVLGDAGKRHVERRGKVGDAGRTTARDGR